MRRMIRPQLLARMQHLLKGGLQPPPRWVRAAAAHPPLETPPASAFLASRRKGSSAPETRLVNAFLERNPTYKSVAIDLLGDSEYFPLTFARRQVQLMDGGMTEAGARDLLEKEMGLEAGSREEQYMRQCKETLRAVQGEEEAALRSALSEARKLEDEARAATRRAGPSSPRAK